VERTGRQRGGIINRDRGPPFTNTFGALSRSRPAGVL
jgi:hypothetical protein